MLSTDCDRWPTCMFHDQLDFIKVLDKQSTNNVLWWRIGHLRIRTYTFTLWTWRRLPNTILASLVYACRGGGDVKTHAVVCHCWNCSISRFWWSDHSHLLHRVAECLASFVGLSRTVSGYCILQDRYCGCCPFLGAGAADPKDRNLNQNCPA